MRLAIYAPVFVRPTETFIYDATIELARHFEPVSVIAASRDSADERPFPNVHVIAAPGSRDPLRLMHRLLGAFRNDPDNNAQKAAQRHRIRRKLIELSPDVLLANYGQGGVTVAPVAASLGIPLVVSFHGADASRRARDPEWQRRYRAMFQTAAAVTGPSSYVRDKLITLGSDPQRTHVLHYGIRTDQIRCSLPGGRYDGGEVRFLFVGRLAEKKDPVTLLKSFKAARQQLLPIPSSLTIAGDGPLRTLVEKTIAELELGEHVHALGRQTHDEVRRLFGQAHIYVQHSVTAPDGDEEGLPVSITESLAAGLPVVSTRHSGIPEAVVDGANGFLVDEGDAAAMTQKMVQLARDPALWDKFGENGRQRLEKEFAMDTVQAGLRALLVRVANNQGTDGA